MYLCVCVHMPSVVQYTCNIYIYIFIQYLISKCVKKTMSLFFNLEDPCIQSPKNH